MLIDAESRLKANHRIDNNGGSVLPKLAGIASGRGDILQRKRQCAELQLVSIALTALGAIVAYLQLVNECDC